METPATLGSKFEAQRVKKYLEQKMELTPPRRYGNASTTEPYSPPVWTPTRPGCEAAFALPSYGLST